MADTDADAGTFDMDGMSHKVGDPDCCMPWPQWSTCRHCGGRMHFQAVYGGYYHECEKCHETV